MSRIPLTAQKMKSASQGTKLTRDMTLVSLLFHQVPFSFFLFYFYKKKVYMPLLLTEISITYYGGIKVSNILLIKIQGHVQ